MNKTFDQYKDGDWVMLDKPGHEWDRLQFKAYKSAHTKDAFRLKYGHREILVDISEIRPADSYQDSLERRKMGANDENPSTNIRSSSKSGFNSVHVSDAYDDYGDIYPPVQD